MRHFTSIEGAALIKHLLTVRFGNSDCWKENSDDAQSNKGEFPGGGFGDAVFACDKVGA